MMSSRYLRQIVLVLVMAITCVRTVGAADRDKLLSEPGVYGTFAVFQLDHHWRDQPPATRTAAVEKVKALVEQWSSKILIESYLLRGLSDRGDLMFRLHGTALADSQEFLAALQNTEFGHHLESTGLLHGMSKKANYVPAFPEGLKSELKAPSQSGEKPYAIVIPIRKDAEWWSLDRQARTAMMQEHTEAAIPYHRTVKRKLYHATGLSDADFITYFETEKLDDFHSLILALEQVKEFRHNRRFGHPTLLGTVRPIGDILDLLAK